MNPTQNQRSLSALRVRKLTYAGLYLAIALVLPFITGQIPDIGRMLCPMHIPVLLCGFLCGWPWGLAVGFIAPLLRSALFGMPAMFPDAVGMAFELAVYGTVAGLLHRLLPRKPWSVYAALLTAMVAGRLVWGAVQLGLMGVTGMELTWVIFVKRVVLDSIPGIILQIVLIPILVLALERAGLSLNKQGGNA